MLEGKVIGRVKQSSGYKEFKEKESVIEKSGRNNFCKEKPKISLRKYGLWKKALG